jgi:hypothetical protein
VVDIKPTKTNAEHHVTAELPRRSWAPALHVTGMAR